MTCIFSFLSSQVLRMFLRCSLARIRPRLLHSTTEARLFSRGLAYLNSSVFNAKRAFSTSKNCREMVRETRCGHQHHQHHAEGTGIITKSTADNHYAPDVVIGPAHMKIVLDFTSCFETKSVSGSNTISFTNKFAPVSVTKSVSINALGLKISAVEGVNSWDHDGEKLLLLWDAPFTSKDEKRDVKISYTVANPVGGLYYNIPDARHPDRVSSHCITDNEPEKARYWLPCMDNPSLRSTLEFELTAKSEHLAVGNGKMVSKTDNKNGTSTTKWAMLEAVCPAYLICIAVGDLVQVEDGDVDGYEL
jgi:aminopeptidase N